MMQIMLEVFMTEKVLQVDVSFLATIKFLGSARSRIVSLYLLLKLYT